MATFQLFSNLFCTLKNQRVFWKKSGKIKEEEDPKLTLSHQYS